MIKWKRLRKNIIAGFHQHGPPALQTLLHFRIRKIKKTPISKYNNLLLDQSVTYPCLLLGSCEACQYEKLSGLVNIPRTVVRSKHDWQGWTISNTPPTAKTNWNRDTMVFVWQPIHQLLFYHFAMGFRGQSAAENLCKGWVQQSSTSSAFKAKMKPLLGLTSRIQGKMENDCGSK